MSGEQPCGHCHCNTHDGIQCDDCEQWWCPQCLNQQKDDILTPKLYDALKVVGSFKWSCEHCADSNLVEQLLANKTFSMDELIAFGCNQEALKSETVIPKNTGAMASSKDSGFQAQGVSMNDQMAQMMQMFLQSQQQMIQMMKEERQQERNQRKEELKLILDTIQRSPDSQESPRSESQRVTINRVSSQSSLIHLPKVQLPTFDGNALEWNNFWESFQINVQNHSQLNDKQKLDYLHQVLKGSAFDKIKGLGLEGCKYVEAIAILLKHYADPIFQKEAHWESLHSLPSVRENYCNLEKFVDDARAVTISLERQGVPKGTIDAFVPELRKKLPLSVISEMNKMRLYQKSYSSEMTMDDFLEFLQNFNKFQVRTIEKPKKVLQKEESKQLDGEVGKSVATANFAQSMSTGRKCAFCSNSNHFSDDCRKVSDVKQRREIVSRDEKCFNCLNKGHFAKDCRKKKGCFHCKKEGHNSALCYKRKSGEAHESPNPSKSNGSKAPHVPLESYFASYEQQCGIIMAAFPAKIQNPETKEIKEAFVYLDQGAKFTCINEETAKSLSLTPKSEVVLETSRFNTNQVEKLKSKVVKFNILGPNGFNQSLQSYTVSKMAPPLKIDPIKFDRDAWVVIRQHQPINTPPKYIATTPIDVIIGMDYWHQIVRPDVKTYKVKHNLYIHDTPLGNILYGNAIATDANIQENEVYSHNMFCHIRPNDPIETLWNLEMLGIGPEENQKKVKNEDISDEFKQTINFVNGRYEVGFPWKSKTPSLASNYHVAKRRLSHTLRSLAPTGEATKNFNSYNDIIALQLQLGIIEPVPHSQPDGNLVHYIPHFPVINEDRATTKVRIVYDASAKTRLEKKCLNDLIHCGPSMLSDLTGMLMRFRLQKVAMVADIEKAFLQVGLRKEDRDCTRFLWLRHPEKVSTEENVMALRFTRIPFGINASPYLLGATIAFHLEQNPGQVSDKIRKNIYVDNVVIGCDNTNEAISTYKEAKQLFDKASMNLRQWLSNDALFNEGIPAIDRASGKSIKVLGMMWHIEKDEIQLKPMKEPNEKMTKRTTLQSLARAFDPIGLFSPITIKGKILQQQFWKKELDWDEDLPAELKSKWEEFAKDQAEVVNIKLQRKIMSDSSPNIQLLCFTDASQDAYAACVYLRQGNRSNLIFSKARVSPIQPQMTIPQLELTAVLIGVRALRFVERQIQMPVDRKFLWTDSQIVLHWLHSEKELPVYVSRRKEEIKKGSDIVFGYVGTHENPADHATRGITASQLKNSNWFQGPGWAQEKEENWPSWIPCPTENTQILTPRRPKKVNLVQLNQVTPSQDDPFAIDINRFSQLSKVIRVTAYCKRFLQAMKRLQVPDTITISTVEYANANLAWIKQVQSESFQRQFQALKQRRADQLCKQLDIFLDKNILRCGGRLANANISKESVYPILLPKDHKYTELRIEEAHRKSFHFGVKATLAELRLQYWVPHGYSQVKKVLKNCRICRKVQGESFRPPKMAALPPERIQRAPAFKYTGLDYMGPLAVREKPGEEHQKRWIAIFTCFATRAVHLEIVKDCGTDSVVKCVMRFIARRGTPNTILSDNALQFKKGAKLIAAVWGDQPGDDVKENLTRFYCEQGIKWRYIPEKSPWVGGFYERLIGMVKKALRKVLWKTTIRDEELHTLVTQIEAALNSRPLTAVRSELDAVLRPSDFIAPVSQLSAPPGDPTQDIDPNYNPDPDPDKALRRQWNKIEKKLAQFWQTWQGTYLSELREAHCAHFKAKRGAVARLPKKGEICLIKESSPRSSWKMAKVIDCIVSSDGEVRFANIRLPSGFQTRRGIKDLVPLETNFERFQGEADSGTM